MSGGGLSTIRMQPASSWEFHFSQLQSNSKKARVAKAIAESAQPGPTFAAREGRLVARTRFFIEFRRAPDEHLLLPGRDTKNGGLQNPRARRTWDRPGIWIHAPRRYSARQPSGLRLI